jgi:hypothetical protein
MTKPYYNPRNRNDRAYRTRQSWSEAFDDHIAARRSNEPCGFRVPEAKK